MGRSTGMIAAAVALLVSLTGCGESAKREGAVYDELVRVVDFVDVKLPAMEPAPTLTGPHFTLKVAGQQIGTESQEFAQALQREYPATSGLPAKAGKGAELVLVNLDVEQRNPADTKSAELVTMEVRAGRYKAAVKGLQPRKTIVVAVPAGQPVTLVTTDDGRTQTLDLRTGALGKDVVPELQQPAEQKLDGPATTVNGTLSAFGSLRPYTVVVKPALLERRVYRPDLKWAPQGKAWLFFSMSFTSNSIPKDNAPIPFWVRQEIDHTKAATLTLPDGTKVPGLKGFYVHDPSLGFEVFFTVHFEVPAGTKAGSVTVNLGGTVEAVVSAERTQKVRWSPSPASITVKVALPS